MKFLSLGAYVFLIAACAAAVPPQVLPPTYSAMPTRMWIPIPSDTPAPDKRESPVPFATIQTAPPLWATEFANPLLVRILGQYPAFQDDFGQQLNQGWFSAAPKGGRGPLYAHLEDGTLILKIPDGREHKDSMVYGPKLARKNFVLSLDFKFGKTEPDDIFRLQFKEDDDQNVIVDLSKNETAAIQVHLFNQRLSSTDTYNYFGPEWINVVVILKGAECAVYINHTPLAYLNPCRAIPMVPPRLSFASFHLLSATGYPAAVTIDNVQSWDLDQIP